MITTLTYISVLINIAFGLLGMLFVIQKNALRLLLLLTCGAAMTGFVFHVGTIWNPMKVAQFCCVVFVGCYFRDIVRSTPKRYLRVVMFFAICIVVSLLDAYFLIPPRVVEIGGGLQGRLFRPIVQTYTIVSALAVFAVGVVGFRQPKSIRRFVTGYFLFALFAATVGWLQFILERLEIGFLPILRAGGNVTEAAAFINETGSYTYRIFAFSGEPKHLATFLLPTVVILLVMSAMRDERTQMRRYVGVSLLVTLPILLLTYSTAGLVALAMSLAVIAVLVAGTRGASLPRMIGLFVALAIVGVTAKLVTDDGSSQPSMATAMYDRSFARLFREFGERPETRALNYIFVERPESLLFGLGPGMYNYHLDAFTMFGEENLGVKQINSGWVVLLVDLGLIGFLTFLCLIGGVLKEGLFASSSAARIPSWHLLHVACIGGIISSACMNAGTSAFPLILLFCAATISSCRIIAMHSAKSRERARASRMQDADLPSVPAFS